MYKKISIIVLLAVLLILLLYIRPFSDSDHPNFKIELILPEADVVGTIQVLDLLKETSELLVFNDVKSRQFLTYEFMLSMAKKYGIDLQSKVYLFANDRGDYGFVIPLLKSSKLEKAYERVAMDFEVTDTIIGKDQVFKINEEDLFFFKRKQYAVIYKGKYFSEIYGQLSNKSTELRKSWKTLLSNPYFKNEHLVMYAKNDKLNDLGIGHVFLAHDSDSTDFYLKSRIVMNDSIPFLINENGRSIDYSSSSDRMIDIHLNFQKLNVNTKDLIAAKLKNIAKKINFPIKDFIALWAGDLCFEEGGFYTVFEKYVETQLDENFETQEVEMTKEIIVPRYKLMVSTIGPATPFINKLLTKGILTKEDEKYRFLFSPLFKMKIYKNYCMFYTNENIPKVIPSETNKLKWEYNGVLFNFDIDSSVNNTLYGGVKIPAKDLLEGFPL